MKKCTIGILLSPGGEGISNVILEYMSLGLPVIATDLGGNREIVQHGLTGVLVPDHSVERIAKEIGTMFEMPEKTKQMGLMGKERVEKEFGFKRMVREYSNLYTLVISNYK